MAHTFRGGIHVDEHKHTSHKKTEPMREPDKVSIPMAQHIGAPAVPLVKVGDHVTVGQKIGEVPEGALGCPVHSSISGTVTEISKKLIPTGASVEYVSIENDHMSEPCPDLKPLAKRLTEATPDEIIEKVREAGISGMGGAAFPTYAKMRSAIGKADTLIINCAECEPFITVNHRLLLENSSTVVNGVKILMRALGVKRVFIAVEDNKPDAIKILRSLVERSNIIKVEVVKTKYPQGDERQLIYALTKKEVPTGKLPADVGCVIFNPETAAAVYRAFVKGTPLISRCVTVDGDCIKKPKNLLVPIGTSINDLIDYCGGLVKTPKKIVIGGPMMGIAQWDPSMPVTKSTSAVLVFSEKFDRKKVDTPTCIHCGRCVNNCPMHIMPMYIAQFAQEGDFERAEKYGAMSCVECGSCSYNCPGGVDIVQFIRVAKAAIRFEQNRAKQQAPKKQ